MKNAEKEIDEYCEEEFMEFAKYWINDIKYQLTKLDNCLEDENKIELEQDIISLLCDIESKQNK